MAFVIVYLFVAIIYYLIYVNAINKIADGSIVELFDWGKGMNFITFDQVNKKYEAIFKSETIGWLLILLISLLWPLVLYRDIKDKFTQK